VTDTENLHRLSAEELSLLRHYRRLNPANQAFIDRMIEGADALSADQLHPPSNIVVFPPSVRL
jgi:hypothetical protein